MGMFLWVFSIRADVRLSEIFGSRMMVQRDKPLIVWGKADPDEAVSVTFSEQIRATVADRKGRWQVTFDPVAFDPELPARSLNINGKNQITINDVVVGDLWLWAGENTPNYPTKDSDELVNQSGSSDHPSLHWFAMDSVSSDGLKIEVPAKWNRFDLSALDETGSAAEVFAVELHQRLSVPIGIILATEPRTSIESWISPASNKTKSAGMFNAMIAPLARVSFSGVIWDHGESNLNHSVQYRRLLPLLIHDWRSVFHDDNLPFLIVQLRARKFSDSELSSEKEPSHNRLDEKPLLRLNPQAAAELREAQASVLNGWRLNPYEEDDTVHVKDHVITMAPGQAMTGATWDGPITRMNYEISLDAKRIAGEDFFCGLTFPVGPECCSLILGGWAGQVVGLSSLDYLDASQNETSRRMNFEMDRWYSVRVRVTPFRIEAWLDGKSIVDAVTTNRQIDIRLTVSPSKPLGVATYFTTGAFRNFTSRILTPVPMGSSSRKRSLQQIALPKTGIAVTVDLGAEPSSSRLGKRLFHLAMTNAYHQKDLYWPSPAFESMEIEKEQIRIRFRRLDFFMDQQGELSGFTIASARGRWRPANAKIESSRGDYRSTVVVSAPGVEQPQAVRYLWQDLPTVSGGFLYRDDGMPVIPFQAGNRVGRAVPARRMK